MMDGSDAVRNAFASGVPVAGAGGDLPPCPPEPGEPVERSCAELPLNDTGNGARFLAYGGRERSIFVPRMGWHVWTGKVWKMDDDKILIRRIAQAVGPRVLREVPWVALTDEEREAVEAAKGADKSLKEILQKDRDDVTGADRIRELEYRRQIDAGKEAKKALTQRKRAHTNWARSTGDSAKINNMLIEASVDVAVDLNDFNTDPLAICCESGVVRLMAPEAAGEPWRAVLEPHCREDRISKMMPVEYDPEAGCPAFLAFLEQIMPDPEIRDFLRRWFGYTLTALTVEQKLAFFYGSGRNGKSTLVDIIAKIMADYGTTVPIETLTGVEQRKGSDATPDLVRIPGARMVRASEPETGAKMKEALVKALTGGEPILVRRMQQEFTEVTPVFKLTISGNAKPEIRGGDDGIWRRVLLVPFDVQVAKEDVDPLLPKKLEAEMNGIFQWLLSGALDYLETGLQVPSVIDEATQKYRETSDPLRVFLLKGCEITGDPKDFERAVELREAFQAWQLEEGGDSWGARAISNELKRRAEILRHPETNAAWSYIKRSNTGYCGIRLTDEARALKNQYFPEVTV